MSSNYSTPIGLMHLDIPLLTSGMMMPINRRSLKSLPCWNIDLNTNGLHEHVCGFTFGFFSLDMIREYIDFYSRKILPTSRFYDVSPFSDGPAASIGDGQSKFERLPGYLRKERKRVKVQPALEKALKEFEKDAL